MHLEKIEISGFKSFADKTVLHFNQPITAIVGPNGCGKSNIVDAFRWVLGEGSAKSLRSDKMVDVIFSGSVKRKPLNYAQISLTFTQIKQALSIGFDELCISRRIHRNGESEWLINKNPVRLKDVHKILWEAGMGKNAFYIFEQGKVDQLITSTPLERRTIFEEAAKIMLFKEKKRESLRKLGQVEENLKRVLDIQAEVEKQIEKLTKQAEEAKIYTENQLTLKELEEGLFIVKWNHYKKKKIGAQTKQTENVQKQEDQEKQIEQKEKELESSKKIHDNLTADTKQAYENFFEVKKAKELAQFEWNIHQKKITELKDQVENQTKQLKELHKNHLKEQKTFEENLSDLQGKRNEIASLSSSLQKINDSLKGLEQSVEKESEHRKKAQQTLIELIRQENEAETEDKKLLSSSEHLEEKLAQLEKAKQNQEEEFERLLKTTLESQNELSQLKKDNVVSQDQLQKLQSELSKKQLLLEEEQAAHQKILEELSETKASVLVLNNLKNEMEGYHQTTQELLKSSKDTNHPLYEKVFLLTDWFKPKKGYEQKVSTILQSYLQSLVVQSHQDLRLLFEWAQKEKLSSFSCLCLEDLADPPKDAKLELAQLNQVSWHFLSHLQNKKEVQTEFVKKDFYLDALGVYHCYSKDEKNVFLRSLELEEKEQKLKELEKQNEKLSLKIQERKENLHVLRQKEDELKKTHQSLEIQIHRIEDALNHSINQKEALNEELKANQKQKEELRTSIDELVLKQKETSKLSKQHEKKRLLQQEEFNKIEGQFEANFSSLKEKRGLKQSLEEKMKTTEVRAQSLRESIRIFESKSDHFEEQVQKMSDFIEEKELSLKELSKQSHEFQEKANQKESELQAAEEKYQENEGKLEQIESAQKELQQELKKDREAFNTLKNEEIEITSHLSEVRAQTSMILQEIEEKLNWTLETLEEKPLPASITLGKTEREIKKLRQRLLEQPEVNLKALSECEAEKSRFEFLQSQVDDLKVSQDELLKIITDLDDSSRQKFQKTFEEIREQFKTNFNLLFNGGEADLELAPHEDLLEAGIEITAQPPGKKMRSIQLLSGGEKCLCAIALLFALFETQSIPFCILDEIDAPLDDTNIERFTNVLKKFVEKHQFIIITHNKRTMAISDQILGVSMQEKGVTQILPLQFSHKPSEEKALTH